MLEVHTKQLLSFAPASGHLPPISSLTRLGEPARIQRPVGVCRQHGVQCLHSSSGQRAGGRKRQRHPRAAATSQLQRHSIAHSILFQWEGAGAACVGQNLAEQAAVQHGCVHTSCGQASPEAGLPAFAAVPKHLRTCSPTTAGGASSASASDRTSGKGSPAPGAVGGPAPSREERGGGDTSIRSAPSSDSAPASSERTSAAEVAQAGREQAGGRQAARGRHSWCAQRVHFSEHSVPTPVWGTSGSLGCPPAAPGPPPGGRCTHRPCAFQRKQCTLHSLQLAHLLLQAVHQVHHQDGNVAQAAAARPQVAAEEGGAARFRSGARHRGVEGE